MNTVESKFSFEGEEIHTYYVAATNPKAITVLVHGMGEHFNRYREDIIPLLIAENISVFGYDNIGHGKTTGKRGHCSSYKALQDVLGVMVNKAKEKLPQLPVFLYGHSLGGNLILNYAIKKGDINGVMASSPYLKLAFDPPAWKMILGKLMLKIYPSITLATGLDQSAISRNRTEVLTYKEDPLVHDVVSPMYSFPIMESGEWAIEHAHKLKVPALLTHGTGDRIIDHNGSIAFHENANTTSLKLLEGGYHELHKDYCKEELYSILQNWLKTQL